MCEKIKEFFNKNHNWIFLLVFLVYGFLLFFNFFRQEIINWDEGYFLTVAHTYSNVIRTLFDEPTYLLGADYYVNLISNYGNVYTAARPTYVILTSLVDAVWPSEYSTRLVSALAGIVSFLFFYRLLDFYKINKTVKLAGAMLFGLSPLMLIYARLGLSQILSATLLLLSIYQLFIYLEKNNDRNLKLFSLGLSLLLLSHYNTIFSVGTLIIYALVILFYKKKYKEVGLLGFFFVLPILVWEGVTRVGYYLAITKQFISMNGEQKIYSYIQEFFEQLGRADSSRGLIIDQPLYYPRLLLENENIFFLVLLIIGIYLFTRKIKEFQYHVPLIVGMSSLALFSLAPLKFPRNIILILPILYLYSIVALDYLTKKIINVNLQKVFLALLCFLFFLINSPLFYNILNLDGGYRKTARKIMDVFPEDRIILLTSSAPIWRNYLPGYKVEPIFEPEAWKEAKKKNLKILVAGDNFMEIEKHRNYYSSYESKIVSEVASNIVEVKPIMLDFFYKPEKEVRDLLKKSELRYIRIYEIVNNNPSL